MGIFDKILRSGEGKKLKALQSLTPDINALEPEMEGSTTPRCRPRPASSGSGSTNGEDLDDLLIEAFAVVREAGKRVLGQRHYDVQLIGGAALHFGWIAEMKTGEGKTLVSTLPAYLNGLSRQRRPPHHGQRLPGPPRLGVDGPPAPLARPLASASSSRATSTPPTSASSTPPTSPTARTTSSASTTSATTWR